MRLCVCVYNLGREKFLFLILCYINVLRGGNKKKKERKNKEKEKKIVIIRVI